MISFFGKPKFSSAFSFDESGLKYVNLERAKSGVQVIAHATIDMAGIMDRSGKILDDGRFVTRLREFGAAQNIKETNVVVPDSQATVFHTHVAKSFPRQMDDIITDHIKTYCEANGLLSFGDYICEYDVIRETPSGYDIHVTLVKKADVSHIGRLFRQAGILANHIETAHHAVARACMRVPVGSAYASVAMGRKKTSVSIVHGEHLVSNDVVDVGTDDLVQTVAAKLRISKSDAQNIIDKHGVMPSHPDTAVLSELYLALNPISASIDRQIVQNAQKTYKSFGERFDVQAVIVYGEGLSVRGVVDFLGKAARLPAFGLDVWAGTDRAPILNLPASEVPHYAEALAMAIVHLGK